MEKEPSSPNVSLHLIVFSCFTAKGILCGSAGAIGDKPGEGHQSGAARAEEIPAAAQGAHGELSEGGVHNEKAAEEKGNAREHREGAQGESSYSLLALHE